MRGEAALATRPLTFTVTFAYIITALTQSRTLDKYRDTYAQLPSPSMFPSSPDKELPAIPTEDTMARLSAPANETPKTERKSKGIRSLFKHRPSSSASSSPATLMNMPPLKDSSPLPSPTVRSGFKQVGLLPSERSYSSFFHRSKQEEQGRESSVNAATKEEEASPKSSKKGQSKDCGLTRVDDEDERIRQESRSRLQSLNDALSNYPSEQAAHEAAVAEVAATDIGQAISSDTDKRSSLPFGSSHKIAEAINGKPEYFQDIPLLTNTVTEKSRPSRKTTGLSGVQNLSLGSFCKQIQSKVTYIAANRLSDVPQSDSESDGEYRDSLSPEEYKTHSIAKTNDFLKKKRMSQYPSQAGPSTSSAYGVTYPYPLTTPREAEYDITLIEEDDSGCRRSVASNIFDDDDELSQGVREYVTSKIAEALMEHDKKVHGRMQTAAGPPVQIIVNINLASLAKTSDTLDMKSDEAKPNILTGGSIIGPLPLTHPIVAKNLRLGMIAVYAIALLGAALMGPKSLLLASWRFSVVFAVYAVIAQQRSWGVNVENDVLLAPVFLAKKIAQELGGRVLVQLRGTVLSVTTEALQGVFKGVDVRAERK
jgi:hypothetical protein